MVSKKLIPVLLAASVGAWACSDSPVSPTMTGVGGTQDSLAKGKPTPPPPPNPADYDMSLQAAISSPDHDGLPSPGHLAMSAARVSGALTLSGKGFPEGSISGTLNGLNITGVDELPDDFTGGDPCQAPEIEQLTNLGLVGVASSLGGSLSMTFSELTVRIAPGTPRTTYGLIEWQLDGVLDNQGSVWTLAGHSGRSNPHLFGPVYELTGWPNAVLATVENSVIDFIGPSLTVLKCRVDYTMSLTQVSGS